MGCGLSNVSKVQEASKVSESYPKISIVPIEPINIDKKMPKGYIEPESSITFTDFNEDDHLTDIVSFLFVFTINFSEF